MSQEEIPEKVHGEVTSEGISHLVSTFKLDGVFFSFWLKFTCFKNQFQEQGSLDLLVGAVMRDVGVLTKLGHPKVVIAKL